MKRFNNFRRLLRAAAVVTVVAAMTFAGCTKVDDTLGSNLVPDNQQMKAGYQTFGALTLTGDLNPRRYVETRLYQTDSLITSNLSYGYMGSMLSDTFGLRTAGFLTQYIPYEIDSGYFGFRPILDSAIILLSISSYGSDTLTPQLYNVYEVVSNKYLTEKPVESGKSERDTTFYLNFDPVKAGAVGNEVLFTFTFPDGEKTGPATTYATMKPTQKGREFINRLMLQEGTYKGDYSIYSLDSLEQWVAEFKGLYIVPAVDQTSPNKGNIYVSWMCRLLLLRPLLLSASLLTSVQAQHKSRSHCPLRLHRTRTYKQSGCASAFSDTAPSCKRNPYSSPSGLSPAPPRLCTGMRNTSSFLRIA